MNSLSDRVARPATISHNIALTVAAFERQHAQDATTRPHQTEKPAPSSEMSYIMHMAKEERDLLEDVDSSSGDEGAIEQVRQYEDLLRRMGEEEQRMGIHFGAAPDHEAAAASGIPSGEADSETISSSVTPPIATGLVEPLSTPVSERPDPATSVPASGHRAYPHLKQERSTGKSSASASEKETALAGSDRGLVYSDEYDIEEGWGSGMPGEGSTIKYGKSRQHHQPAQPSHPPAVGRADLELSQPVLTGASGVDFTMQSQGNVLPGYPTEGGMAKLMKDRLASDEAQLSGSGTSLR